MCVEGYGVVNGDDGCICANVFFPVLVSVACTVYYM
jgi:hypothetical protein